MENRDFYQHIRAEIEKLTNLDQWRNLKSVSSKGKFINFNDKLVLNLSSNDYLGLARDTDFTKSFHSSIKELAVPFSNSSSRLLTGNSVEYQLLEDYISAQYSSISKNPKDCLVINSGYHANVGILSALFSKGDLILSDKLNHASLVDGARLSYAETLRFNHRDYEQLEQILQKNRERYRNVIIVSESIFSMDGDNANLNQLVELKKKYNAALYIDEAHSVGIFGSGGLGLSVEIDRINEIDILVGTFGKAYASIGAFAIVNPSIKDFLINKLRTLIFTTALPPINLLWTLRAVQKANEMDNARKNLFVISNRLRAEFERRGIETRGCSQIIPVICGSNKKTLQLANYLQDNGYLLMAVRPPTVPKGTSRLRLSLSADIQWEDIKELPLLIEKGLKEF